MYNMCRCEGAVVRNTCEGTARDLRPPEYQHALGITEPRRVRSTLPLYAPWLPWRALQGRHLSLQEVDQATATSAHSSGGHRGNDLSPASPACLVQTSLPADVGQANCITSISTVMPRAVLHCHIK
ncbi:hypothetical protein PR048_027600 [Dryococelus australis]|uniref:Uncharacterized protein n=1 Tax=Dryococelus australis TaxID=614101 RepID=A0ABQ9GGY6_9NEOP|nr:hypothetical protein PR048_027600 [Dryococelus australis]